MEGYMRDTSVEFEGIGFESDKYGEGGYADLAESIPRQVKKLAEGFKRVYVPLDPSIPEHSFEDIDHKAIAEGDKDTLYLFLGKFKGEMPEDFLVAYTQEDAEITSKIGYAYENQIYMEDTKLLGSLAHLFEKNKPVPLTEFKKIVEEQKRETIRNLFVGDFKEREEHLENQISQCKSSIENFSTQLYAKRRQAMQLQHELYGLQMFSKDQEEEVEKVFKTVTRMTENSSKLKSVEFGKGSVIFNTGRICIEDDFGNVHPIGGSMKVKVVPDTIDVIITNNDNYIDEDFASDNGIPRDIQHPHVDGSGHPCLGNASEMLADACSRKDIEAIWQVVLSYLESYNSGDVWGMRIAAYPVEEGGISEDLTYTTCKRCGDTIGVAADVKHCTKCDEPLCPRCYETYEGLCNDCYGDEDEDEECEECEFDE